MRMLRGYRLRWTVSAEGRLLFANNCDRRSKWRDVSPIYPLSLTDLEEKVGRMKEKIAASGFPIVIKKIFIEQHIATGFWNEGSITLKHLESSRPGTNGGIEFDLELCGEKYTVCIQTATHYGDYEFIVDGHPEGAVRVKDLPDAFCQVSGEDYFLPKKVGASKN
jgi:hypothetical protein